MPNAQQPLSTYPPTYPNTETMLHLSRQARNDPLDLNEYVMSGTHHPRFEAVLQGSQSARQSPNVPVVPVSPYPTFTSPFQNSPGDMGAPFSLSSDGRLESPVDRKGSIIQRDRINLSEMSCGGGNGSAAYVPDRRASFSSPAPAIYANRTRSLDASSATSRTSSREPGARAKGDVVSRQGNITDGGISGYDVNGDDTEVKGRPPPWSDLKTKAGKERKRLPLACIACRRKKIRCSGEKPACKHCLRSRIPCVYKVTARKAAPRTDYMAMLDKRLRRMEERVIKIIPKEEMGDLADIGRAIVKPGMSALSVKAAGSKKRAADDAFGAELDEWSTANRDNVPGPPIDSSKGQDAEESRLLTEGAESLPSKEIQEHLSEVFFDCLYGQSYLLLHKPSFMRRLR